MALERIYNPNTRWYLFYPEAIKDFASVAESEEISAKVLNDAVAAGLGFNITCAVNQDGSNFDLGDSETDDSLTFCQVAGSVNPTSLNPDIQYEVEMSRDRKAKNVANTAVNLIAYKGREYFAVLSVGETPDAPFAAGERVKMARVVTDYGTYQIGSGENIRVQSQLGNRGDVAWNIKVTA